MPAHECNRYHALPLSLPLGLCFCRWMWCCFVLCKVGTIIMTVAINALPAEPMHFYALEVLASCSTRRVRLHFVLCKVSSIIMTVAINAHYLPLVDFYAPALLASRFFCAFIAPGYAGASGTVVVSQQVCKYQFVLCKVSTFLLVGWLRTALFLLAPPTGGAPIKGGVTEA
jgi:hypothetical protein